MKSRHIPNLISLIRILLVVPTVIYLLEADYTLALVLILIAGLSDGLDGLLARRYGWMSRLGAILDPIGDKLLMVSCYLTLGWLEQLPVWLVIAVIARDVVIVAGALAYHLLIEEVSMEPTLVSKLNTGLQVLLLLLVIFSLSTLPAATLVPAVLIQSLILLVMASTVLSGTMYVLIWARRALLVVRERQEDA